MKQTQEQLQVRMKMLDDVFHNVIISLERLEAFLQQDKSKIKATTAINTKRDLHDDVKNPPTKKLLYGEVQLQCSALFFQTKFDDDELFKKTIKYFLEDLLKWYGGRPEDTPFDDIDKFFIPLVSSLSRQIDSVIQITQTVTKYVGDINNDISKFSNEDKEKAVTEGFSAWIKAQDVVEQSNRNFLEEGKDIVFTAHERGNMSDGYERLLNAFLTIYENTTPVKFLENTKNIYIPDFKFDSTKVLLNKINQLKNKNI